MAVAYAALMCLMRTSEMILHPYQPWLHIDRNMIESLLQKVRLLQEFLEGYSHRGHEEMDGLESQITDMAYAAEDVIESHVLDQNPARSTGSQQAHVLDQNPARSTGSQQAERFRCTVKYFFENITLPSVVNCIGRGQICKKNAKSSTSFSEYIHKVIEDMEDLIKNKLMKIKETIGKFEEDPNFVDFSPAVPSRLAPNEQNTPVGSDEKLKEILDILTGQQSNRQIVVIAGMGGIGKTTLAKHVYEHPLIKQHFDICAWATISQKYSARKIISEMLSEIGHSRPESLSDEQLGVQLYKSLCDRRYLIVLDDFWSIEAWDEIKRFFPDHGNNESRIMITTRLGKVAAHLSSCRPFEMEFLDADRSWELLSKKVFGHHRGCPPELEGLGKTIAKNTEGLPLAIVVIGGLLAKSNKTMELWRHVAENLSSIINSEDKEKCLKMLSLSYNNLPIHLKPCFLYMAMARKKSDIDDLPWLIRVWVCEGFVKPIRGKSLEEAAYEYITDLIDRNLISVRTRQDTGKLQSCGMHDLLRDLCMREAQKLNLCGVIHVRNPKIAFDTEFMQALLKPKRDIPCDALEENGNSRLLRLLDSSYLPDENLQLMNLRFISFPLDLDLYSRFISSISLFWNIQTLKISNYSSDRDEPLYLPPGIWILPHLRHLVCATCVLPDPHIDKYDSHILENLQTLSKVAYFRCTEEVCRSIPNLKELQVTYEGLSPGVEWPSFGLHNLLHLQKLESLHFYAESPISSEYLSFPLSLKQLTLIGCRIPWEDMTIVGSLPNLEVLRLAYHAFKGKTWCPIEGQFVKLKVLWIWTTDLVHWRADKTHLPILEHLALHNLNLEEFPEEFGEHPTLGEIKVYNCSDSTIAWAKQIHEEQKSFGNEGFRVDVFVYGDLRSGLFTRNIAAAAAAEI